jgi:hypothetical protein
VWSCASTQVRTWDFVWRNDADTKFIQNISTDPVLLEADITAGYRNSLKRNYRKKILVAGYKTYVTASRIYVDGLKSDFVFTHYNAIY